MSFKPFDADAVIEAASAMLRLDVLPEDRPGVRNHLKTAAKMAALLEQAGIDERTEPAPVYRP